MFLTIFAILGFVLKLLGVTFGAINTMRQFRTWKEKEMARLYEANFQYRKTGTKPHVAMWRRMVYRRCKMPMSHLWETDREPPACVKG